MSKSTVDEQRTKASLPSVKKGISQQEAALQGTSQVCWFTVKQQPSGCLRLLHLCSDPKAGRAGWHQPPPGKPISNARSRDRCSPHIQVAGPWHHPDPGCKVYFPYVSEVPQSSGGQQAQPLLCSARCLSPAASAPFAHASSCHRTTKCCKNHGFLPPAWKPQHKRLGLL